MPVKMAHADELSEQPLKLGAVSSTAFCSALLTSILLLSALHYNDEGASSAVPGPVQAGG